jgi:hypothetical protein
MAKGKALVKRPGLDEAGLERRAKLQAHFLTAMIEHNEWDPLAVAQKLARGDARKAKLWRKRWHRWMKQEDFQGMVAEMSMARLRGGIPAIVDALVRRASKGNVPAIKLALEASGFWSPRSQVEHTGEIAITLKGIERPQLVVDEDNSVEGDIVEADVVE